MKIQVRECPFTHKLFKSDREYARHLKWLRKENKLLRHKRWETQAHREWVLKMSKEVISVAGLTRRIHKDWKKFCYNHWLHNSWRTKGSAFDESQYPELLLVRLDIKWNDRVSNSHSAPRDGETNWGGRKKDVPTSYPGWSGSIEYVITRKDSSSFNSDFWKGTGINTGSGGGASTTKENYHYAYQVELFASDWPAWSEAIQQQKTWDILAESR